MHGQRVHPWCGIVCSHRHTLRLHRCGRSQLLRHLSKSASRPLLPAGLCEFTRPSALPLRSSVMLTATAPARFFLLMCRRHRLCLPGWPHSHGVQAGGCQPGLAGASSLPAGDEWGKSAGLGALHPPQEGGLGRRRSGAAAAAPHVPYFPRGGLQEHQHCANASVQGSLLGRRSCSAVTASPPGLWPCPSWRLRERQWCCPCRCARQIVCTSCPPLSLQCPLGLQLRQPCCCGLLAAVLPLAAQ